MEKATFGGGCFWCLEAVFQEIKGVLKVQSGYAGGDEVNPTYESVCHGDSGHAEVVQLHFDPQVISYKTLVQIFLLSHDPTTLNRQGGDVGEQYRSIILYHDENQKAVANDVIQNLAKFWKDPIVTQVKPLTTFYVAEDYHQNFYRDNPQESYCSFVIEPKLAQLRQLLFKHMK